MDLGTLIGAIVGVLGFCATVAGAFVGYGRLNGKVDAATTEILDLKEETKTLRQEVDEAQKSARAVDGLAKAVEHMGERFADQIKHLVETFSLETSHTRAQLADIKDELRTTRAGAARARSKVGS